MPVTFSNPRLLAEFPDWPLGGSKRGTCNFSVEKHDRRGYRACRITTGKPKYTTYGGKMAIVDGDNGHTYLLQQSDGRGMDSVRVIRSDFFDASEEVTGSKGYTYAGQPRYPELLALIQQANP